MIGEPSLGRRLGLAFALLATLVLLTGVVALVMLRNSTVSVAALQRDVERAATVDAVSDAWREMSAILETMLVERSVSRLESRLAEQQAQLRTELEALSSAEVVPDGVSELLVLAEELQDSVDTLTVLGAAGNWEEAETLYDADFAALAQRFETAIADTQTGLRAEVSPAATQALAAQTRIQNLWIGSLLLILLGTAVTAWFLRRDIVYPVTKLNRQAAQLAAGEYAPPEPLARNDEIGNLSQSLVGLAVLLRETKAEMDTRVAERTRALELIADIGRNLSTILDPNLLIEELVEQTRQTFGYYYTQIYLFEPEDKVLRLAAATGLAGRNLLFRGHRLAVGQGLVGKAAEQRKTVLVDDVTESADWFPNLELPETRSEVSVPIIYGTRLLGVLDVQQDTLAGLTTTDVALLESIASQVAVALQNARLYAQAQRRAEREEQINVISQQIRKTSTVDEALRVAAVALTASLNAQQTRVSLTREADLGENSLGAGVPE